MRALHDPERHVEARWYGGGAAQEGFLAAFETPGCADLFT
jgi:hypothetical protein